MTRYGIYNFTCKRWIIVDQDNYDTMKKCEARFELINSPAAIQNDYKICIHSCRLEDYIKEKKRLGPAMFIDCCKPTIYNKKEADKEELDYLIRVLEL